MAAYAPQREEHLTKKDEVLRAINNGDHRFSKILGSVKISRRTLAKILVELERDVLIAKEGEGQGIRYQPTTNAHEILKGDISAFRDISEAYEKWHPSLQYYQSGKEGPHFTVGSQAHFPLIQTGMIYSGSTEGVDNFEWLNMPKDRFVANGAEMEGLVQGVVMNFVVANGMRYYRKGNSTKHGKQHVAVVIDYDLLQQYWDMADDFEDKITGKNSSMNLFFSKILNLDPEDDPVLKEMEKTGMMGEDCLVNLDARHKNALRITRSLLPVMLKMILMTKPLEDSTILIKAIGNAIDGPFQDIVDIYHREYGELWSNYEDLEGDKFQAKVYKYLKKKGVQRVTMVELGEIMGVYLLASFKADNPESTLNILTHWGAPFMF